MYANYILGQFERALLVLRGPLEGKKVIKLGVRCHHPSTCHLHDLVRRD